MVHQLILHTDRKFGGMDERVEARWIRASIINALKGKISEEDMRYVNFRPVETEGGRKYPLPYILYQFPLPGLKRIEVFAFGERGLKIIEKMGKKLKDVTLFAKREPIFVKGWKIKRNAEYFPKPVSGNLIYRTVTPLILYDKGGATSFFYAIQQEMLRSRNPAIRNEGLEILKKDIIDKLRKNMAIQLKERFNVTAAHEIAAEPNLEIREFRHFWKKYHPDRPPTPMITMTLESDWRIPFFLGHHTGIGYGRLMINIRESGYGI